MKQGASVSSFGAQLKALREAAGFTQEELATIAGLSVHAVSALERGERRRPHVETVRLLATALDLPSGEREALLRSARPASAGPSGPRASALPVPPTALIGREADLDALRASLADTRSRLVTLTGPGGAGKSRLALEVARGAAAGPDTRVVFVPLAALQSAPFVALAIADALGLPDASALELPRAARIACEGASVLLVLDNFEHVLDAAPLVADLLAAVESLRVLVTSRAPLRIRGEREQALGPLALAADPETAPLAELERSPAVQLFADRVRDVDPRFRVTAGNAATVAAICRRLDALPLALELAAPWMKVLTPEGLLHRLADDDLLPAVGPRDLPERQHTMNATVAWSYRLLDASQQQVFRALGVLPGRFPIDAASAVVAGSAPADAATPRLLQEVAALVDRSLLVRAESSIASRPLYRMLEAVRSFAALELAASGERDRALEGLAAYAVSSAAEASSVRNGPSQPEWLDRVRDDLENYRGALAWLVEAGRAKEASAIASGLYLFWVVRGHAAEGLEWYERILALPSLAPLAEGHCLVCAATMLYVQGSLERARAGLARAHALAVAADDPALLAHAEEMLGHVAHATGDDQSARGHFERSVEASRPLGMPWRTGGALTGLAWVALATGGFEEAERRLGEAASMLRDAGPWFLLLTLYLRAVLAIRHGRSDEALAHVRENLTIVRAIGDRFAFVYALVPLAAAAVLRGDDGWAARILGARDAVTECTGAIVVDASVHDLRTEAEREARSRLGPERWDRAYAAGRAASIDSLLDDIDRALEAVEYRRGPGD